MSSFAREGPECFGEAGVHQGALLFANKVVHNSPPIPFLATVRCKTTDNDVQIQRQISLLRGTPVVSASFARFLREIVSPPPEGVRQVLYERICEWISDLGRTGCIDIDTGDELVAPVLAFINSSAELRSYVADSSARPPLCVWIGRAFRS